MSNPVMEGGSTQLERIDLWNGFKGINPTSPGPLIGREYARRAHGMYVDERGLLGNAEASAADGSVTGGVTVLAFFTLAAATNATLLFIGATDGFYYTIVANAASTWAQLTGPAITISSGNDRWSFVRWNDTIIAATAKTGETLYEIDTSVIPPVYVAIAASPAAFHVTAFANRVIASRVTGNLGYVQWSVKNDSNDWAGLGSGFEDLLAAAGSNADRPWSVWPISETEAIVVCERCLMRMSTTDNFDAPFRFSLIDGAEGTPFPDSVAKVPGGIVYAGWTGFWYVTADSITPLGKPYLDSLLFGQEFGAADHPSAVITRHGGVYVAAKSEYWFRTAALVYRCFLPSKAWTTSVAPASTGSAMAYTETLLADTAVKDWQVNFANGVFINRVRGSTLTVAGEVISGDIELDLPENRLDVAYVSLVYSTRDTTVRTIEIQISRNDGNWETYGTFSTKPYVSSSLDDSPTNRTHRATIHKSLSADKIAFKLKIPVSTVAFKLARMSVYCTKSGWVGTTP